MELRHALRTALCARRADRLTKLSSCSSWNARTAEVNSGATKKSSRSSINSAVFQASLSGDTGPPATSSPDAPSVSVLELMSAVILSMPPPAAGALEDDKSDITLDIHTAGAPRGAVVTSE